jgi:hypothetical protein
MSTSYKFDSSDSANSVKACLASRGAYEALCDAAREEFESRLTWDASVWRWTVRFGETHPVCVAHGSSCVRFVLALVEFCGVEGLGSQ